MALPSLQCFKSRLFVHLFFVARVQMCIIFILCLFFHSAPILHMLQFSAWPPQFCNPQVSYRRKALQVYPVQQGLRLVRSPQGSHSDPLRPQGVQVSNVRHHVHHQRQPAASHDYPQWSATLHVPLLPEDLQVITQLQEAHEDTQVGALSGCCRGVIVDTFCLLVRSMTHVMRAKSR